MTIRTKEGMWNKYRVTALLIILIVAAVMFIKPDNAITGRAVDSGAANIPPQWVPQTTKFVTTQNSPLVLQLSDLFKDPEGQQITFSTTSTENLNIILDGDTLQIIPEPGFKGERVVTLFASDGTQVSRQRIKIEVGGTAAVEPQSQPQEQASPPAHSAVVQRRAKIEQALEDAVQGGNTVDAIIVLNDTIPFEFSTKATRQEKRAALDGIKAKVRRNREALLANVNSNAITGAAVSGNDFEIIRQYDTINAIAVRITRAGLEQLRNNPAVAEVVADRKFRAGLSQSVPLINATSVWGVNVNGQNITGRGQTICVIDTGIDMSHPAFAGKILPGYDYINNDANAQDDAGNSHGTHVSGIAAGNSTPVKGVAPDALIVPVKVCNNNGDCDGNAILAGIDYCNNNAVAFNISVISGSLGDNEQYNSSNCPAWFDSALSTSVGLGIIPVFASGNNGFTSGINYPACSPYAISVGSTSKSDTMESYTNRGGDRLDVLAPGGGIVSSVIGGGTGSLSGTSMATPHVSGAIALIQQNEIANGRPALTLAQIRNALNETGKLVDSIPRIDVLAAVILLNESIAINASDNSISNVVPPKAKIQFKDPTVLDTIESCAVLGYNFVSIDTVACPQFNKAARITFEGMPQANFVILKDGLPCQSDACQNFTYDNGILEFDVTGFSNYTANISFGTMSSCGTIITTTTFDGNALPSAAGTCIDITGNNLVLDCNGSTITFNTGGGGNAYGITATNQYGITIKNCNIKCGNTAGNYVHGVFFNGVNFSTVYNNTVNNTGGQNTYQHTGIFVANYRDINVTANLVNTSGNQSYGIYSDGAIGTGYAQIINNTVYTRANGFGTENDGIHAGGYFTNSVYVIGNNVVLNDSATSNGIIISIPLTSQSALVENNTITVQGKSSNNDGIYVGQLSKNINFKGNSINVSGTTNTYGIELYYATNLNFTLTNITTAGTSTHYGIYSFESNATFNKTRIANSEKWAYMYFFNLLAKAVYDNTTFATPYGSINILKNFSMDWSFAEINNSDVNVTFNRSFMRSTKPGIRLLNQSPGIVTLNGLGTTVGSLRVDYEDDGTYVACTSSDCNLLSSSGGTVVFNVTHFTTFGANTSGGGPCTSCAECTTCTSTQGNTCTLANGISSTTTCITVGNDNVTINCDGKTITFNTGGGGNDYGITATSRRNLTIANCTINSAASAAGAIPIYFLTTNSSKVLNNTLKSLSSSGLYLVTGFYNTVFANNINASDANANAAFKLGQTAQYNNITSNTFVSGGTTIGDYGVSVESDCHNNTISNNFVVSGDTQTSNYGVYILSSENKIINNSINTTGSDQNHGIFVSTGSNSRIENNSIIVAGPGATKYGIYVLNSVENTFSNNNLATIGSTDCHGINLGTGAYRNTFSLNNISSNCTGAYGIYIDASISGSNFSATILNNTPQWIYTGAGASNNFSNTTFAMPNGSINILPFTQINGSQDITKAKLNITSNKAFLNSTLIPYFNTSAIITLYGITGSNPDPVVDYEDDGSYIACPAGQCTELSYAGGTYVFNTTRFTGYSAQESGITGCPVTINSSYTLTQNLVSNGTCITIGNSSMTLDCAGYSIRYNADGGDNEYGISANLKNNIIVKNCQIIDINDTGVSCYGIQGSSLNYSFYDNNTIRANGTGSSRGINIQQVNGSAITNNYILAEGNSGGTNGIYGVLVFGSYNINITNNIISANDTSAGHTPISISYTNTSSIVNNTLNALGNSSYAYGINAQVNLNFIIANNTITTPAYSFGYGMLLGNVKSSNISGNQISTRGAKSYGIYVAGGSNNNYFTFNNITTNGSLSYGVAIGDSNYSVFNATLLNNASEWINSSGDSYNNFTNTTFWMPNGSINIPDLAQINGTQDITKAKLNISDNKAYLNSTNLTFLNTSAIITLYGITGSNPDPVVDYEDDGSYIACPAGQCTELSYTPGVSYVFNTTHFTGYSTQGSTPSIQKVDLNSTNVLSNDTNQNLTAYVIGASDPNGYPVQNITDWRRNNASISPVYWPFETNSSSTVAGAIRGYSTRQYNATLGSGIATPTWVNNGKVGGAYSFDAINDLMTSAESMDIGTNYSIEFWFNPAGSTSWQVLVGNSFFQSTNFGVLFFTTSQIWYYWNFGSTATSTTNLQTSKWHHVVVTYNGSLTKIYVNGTLEGTSAAHTERFNNSVGVGMELGGWGSSIYYGGLMDEVRVYNRTLSSEQIVQNYQKGLVNLTNNVIVKEETEVGDVWSIAATPNNNQPNTDGTTVLSNNVTIMEGGGPLVVTSCPVTLNSSYTLTQNLESNDTCITLNNSNMVFDCAGYWVRYNANGTNSEYGLFAENRTNITVQNCNIIDINETGSGGDAITLINTTSSTIINNNLTTNGTSANSGLLLNEDSCFNTVTRNSIRTFGSSLGNYGIYLYVYAANNNITNNTVLTNGTSQNVGIMLWAAADNNTVAGNLISTSGSQTENHGISMDSSDRNLVENNSITAAGLGVTYGIQTMTDSINNTVAGNVISTLSGGSNNYGIRAYQHSAFNRFIGNSISTTGSWHSHGISLELNASYNYFALNNITIGGLYSYGISIMNSNSSLFNATLLNDTTNWINASADSYNNFTNTTFWMPYGSINFPETFQLNGSAEVNKTNLEITYNWAHLNSTNLSALNTTGIITLYSLLYSNPKPMVDYEDDGGYVNCPASQCIELGYSGGTFVYNTTHFTTYSSMETSSEITSCPVTINTSTTLTQNLVSNDTCITIGNNSMTLDCAGYSILYNANGTDAEFGIASTGHNNLIIKNCNIRDTNSTGNYGMGINFSYVNDSIITNTNITTNGSQFSNGINMVIDSNRNTITNSTIMTFGLNSYGTYLMYNSSGNNITGNTIQTNGSDSYAIYLVNRITDTIIGSNNITAVGSAIVTTTYSSRNNISDNNITSIYSTGTRYGISITNSENNTIKNNTVLAQDANINLAYSTGNIITGNRLTINTTFFTPYIAYWASTNNTLFSNNTLATVSDGCWLMRINSGLNNFISSNTFLSNNITSFDNNGGIVLQDLINNTFAYNTITGYMGGVGIGFVITGNTNYTNISNNNMSILGSSSHIGIKIGSQSSTQESNSQIIENNQIMLNATSSQGILVTWLSTNNTFRNNKITTTGANSYGVYIGTSNSSFFNSTTINASQGWIILFANTRNNFTNTTFMTQNGTISILPQIQLNGSIEINNSKLNITSNRAFLNSTNLTYFNTSGIITLYNIAYSDPKARVDYADNGGYIDCPASQCSELGYSGGTFVFNTTHFTSYQAAESSIVITGCPVTINTSTTLSQSLTSNDSCITINASNMTLDCNGSTIRYNANGSDNEYGILAENRINVTVKNCVIVDINETGTAGYGINFTSTNNSIVTNTSIITNSTMRAVGIILDYSNNSTISNSTIDASDTNNNWAIGLYSSPNTTITGNTLSSSGGAGNNHGISITFYCDGSTISYNNISSNGTSNNWGIYMQYLNYATISNNTIASNGTDANFGIFSQYSNWNNISSNSLSAHGSGTGNRGIYLMYSSNSIVHGNRAFSDGGQYCNGIAAYTAENNTISFNEISTNGAGFSYGVLLNSTKGFSLLANSIRTNGASSYGIFITMSNATMLNRTVLNDTVQWIFLDSDTQNNFTNTTFLMPDGSINILPLVQINGSQDITKSKLEISTLFAFMNSTNLSMLNTSGIITLNGVTFVDPKPVVDYQDDSSYVDCPPSQCAELGYSGGVFTFNTTHFTGFTVEENATAITGCPAVINSTGSLGSNVTSNATCITINNSNTVFDCNGNTIFYNANGSNGAFGIAANSVQNITIRNCVIRDINVSGAFGIAVNLTNVSNSTVQSNNITTNGTNDNYGIMFMSGLNYNTISNNIVSTFGSSSSNIGLSLYGRGLGNNVTGNNITTNGTAANYGIMVTVGANNTIIASNTIATSGSSSSNDAITLFTTSGNNVTGNNITAYGDTANNGVKLNSNANDNIISNNRIYSAGSNNINYGVYIRDNSARNNITGNNITTNGTDANTAISLELSANNNIIDRNIVSPGGSADFNIGIYLRPQSSGNIITNNNVTTNKGSNNNYGITLANSTNNTISSNIVSTNGTGDLNYGLYVYDEASGNSITNNNITTNGGSNSNDGIGLTFNTNDNIISGNKITAGGRTSYNNGISLLSFAVRNNITNNEISTSGTEHNTGIILEDSAQNNILNNNTITTSGNYSYAIEIINSNYSSFNSTIMNNTVEWINTTGNTFNNFTNTTFLMPEGSINIPGIVQFNGGIEVTKARLNITANRVFLNAVAMPLLNTTGIITLYNIYYTTPIASVDWADTGAIIHCPTSICTNISYSGNVFVFNVTHFTSYSAANDTVIINSTIIDSNISNCTIINSTVINSTKANCTIINSYIINSTNNNTVIIDTNETNSLDNDTVVDDSIIIGSIKINSTINGSTKVNSTIINSNVINSTNYNSTIINTNETNSTDNDSVVDYSTIIGSIKINSTINGSIKIGSNITNSHIINSNNTNSTVINTNETNSTDINSTVDNSIIINAVKIDSNINGSNITNSTINSTVVINSTINSSNLTNCTVTNSTLNGINNQSCNYTNYRGPIPAPGPSGGGGGGGGGGIGGVRRNYTQPVSGGGQNLCIESWACEDWTKCENSAQTRDCVDVRACGTATLKPATQRTCTLPVIEPEKPVEVTRPAIAEPEPLVFPEEKPGIMARIGSTVRSLGTKSLSLLNAYLWPIIFVILGILVLTGAYITATHYKKPEEEAPAEEELKITSVRAPSASSGEDTEELLGSLKSSGDALADFEKAMRKLRK